jgi:hypothetical protein
LTNTLVYYNMATITAVKSLIVHALAAFSVNHYSFAMYGFRIINKTLVYYLSCSFSVHYESFMFYSTDPRSLYIKLITAVVY